MRNWDLAVEGSPMSSTFMSPRLKVPSGIFCTGRPYTVIDPLQMVIADVEAEALSKDCHIGPEHVECPSFSVLRGNLLEHVVERSPVMRWKSLSAAFAQNERI